MVIRNQHNQNHLYTTIYYFPRKSLSWISRRKVQQGFRSRFLSVFGKNQLDKGVKISDDHNMKPIYALIVCNLIVLILGCTTQVMTDASRFDIFPQAAQMRVVNLSSGDVFDLEAGVVYNGINGKLVQMFAYNKQIPGPLLRVKQNSTVTVSFKNVLDMPTTVHWHGVRVQNKYDGVPHGEEGLVLPNASIVYELRFPDEGVYWYHSHVREDMQQELGLYGGILVEPIQEGYYNHVDREEVVFIDDIRLVNNELEYFPSNESNYALMGRFGTQMFVNGNDEYVVDLKTNQSLRLFLINSANTRIFNISIGNFTLRVVGGDSGLYEQEFFAQSVVLAPGERVVIEVIFPNSGDYNIMHTVPSNVYTLGRIRVRGESSQVANASKLRKHVFIQKNIDKFRKYFNTSPDIEINLTLKMVGINQSDNTNMDFQDMTMHQDHMMMNHDNMMMDNKNRMIDDSAALEKPLSIEWEDTMAVMNKMSTSKSIQWVLLDQKSGKQGMDVMYDVHVGDVKNIRFFNDPDSVHPMQHPMHLHGQRFLVLSENGIRNTNLVWKDVVLIQKGGIVDVLVDFSNPGLWMLHCHIAEHLESGMMSLFNVTKMQ